MIPTTEDLKRRVRIRLRAEVENDALGVDEVFDEGRVLWAKVEPIHGLTIRAGMQTGEVPTHLVLVRYTPRTRPQDITASHVFEWGGHRYRVLDAIDVEDRGRFTRVSVKELGRV